MEFVYSGDGAPKVEEEEQNLYFNALAAWFAISRRVCVVAKQQLPSCTNI